MDKRTLLGQLCRKSTSNLFATVDVELRFVLARTFGIIVGMNPEALRGFLQKRPL